MAVPRTCIWFQLFFILNLLNQTLLQSIENGEKRVTKNIIDKIIYRPIDRKDEIDSVKSVGLRKDNQTNPPFISTGNSSYDLTKDNRSYTTHFNKDIDSVKKKVLLEPSVMNIESLESANLQDKDKPLSKAGMRTWSVRSNNIPGFETMTEGYQYSNAYPTEVTTVTWGLPITYTHTPFPIFKPDVWTTGGIEKPNKVHILGTKRTNHTERIMELVPLKDEKYLRTAHSVYVKVQAIKLRTETDDYVKQLHEFVENLPTEEADNARWSKFSRAVVEYFALDFYRNHVTETINFQRSAKSAERKSYNRTFDTTLSYLREKSEYTALQFAAPVRRFANIFRAILETPIDIVQTSCKLYMASWMCQAKYLASLIDESENCENIWHHALIHLKTLKIREDPVDIIINELDSKIDQQPSNSVDNLFHFIVNTIEGLRNELTESLIQKAVLYRDIRNLQRKDLLHCLNIDHKL